MRRTATQLTVLSEGADGAIDNARIARAHRLIADAEPIDRPRAKRFHEYVGGLAEREKGLALGVVLEVQHDAFLAAIEVAEEDRARSIRTGRYAGRGRLRPALRS